MTVLKDSLYVDSRVENPFVDVAVNILFEDIADKQGVVGMVTHMMGLASSLASSMPNEEYSNWEEFKKSLEERASIISAFETIKVPKGRCIVTTKCPFMDGIKEYMRRIGELPEVYNSVIDYYNATVKPSAAVHTCIIHQTFRSEAAQKIRVNGKQVRYAQICSRALSGNIRIIPDEWLPIILEKAGITLTELRMLLRQFPCIWMLY